jgi:hypothetical protein
LNREQLHKSWVYQTDFVAKIRKEDEPTTSTTMLSRAKPRDLVFIRGGHNPHTMHKEYIPPRNTLAPIAHGDGSSLQLSIVAGIENAIIAPMHMPTPVEQ